MRTFREKLLIPTTRLLKILESRIKPALLLLLRFVFSSSLSLSLVDMGDWKSSVDRPSLVTSGVHSPGQDRHLSCHLRWTKAPVTLPVPAVDSPANSDSNTSSLVRLLSKADFVVHIIYFQGLGTSPPPSHHWTPSSLPTMTDEPPGSTWPAILSPLRLLLAKIWKVCSYCWLVDTVELVFLVQTPLRCFHFRFENWNKYNPKWKPKWNKNQDVKLKWHETNSFRSSNQMEEFIRQYRNNNPPNAP